VAGGELDDGAPLGGKALAGAEGEVRIDAGVPVDLNLPFENLHERLVASAPARVVSLASG